MTGRRVAELAQFGLRGLPLWRGKHRLVHLLAPRLGALPEPAYARLSGGAKMLSGTAERPDFWYLGNIEPDVTPVFVRQLKAMSPGKVVVDVGANRGYYTLIAARTHRVFAFEPNDEPMAELEASVSFNGFENVTSIKAAVSDASGKGRLHVHASVSELSSLAQVHDDLDTSFAVETVALDDYFGALTDVQVGLMKLDIQGAELLALKGAASLIERDRPVLIIEEWPYGNETFGYDFSEVKVFLGQFGYSFYRIDKGRIRWSVLRPAHPTEADVGVARDADTNLLCLPSVGL